MAKRFLATQNQRYTAAWSAVTAAPLTLACFASADNATANHAFFGISDNEGFTDAFYLTFEGTAGGDPLRAATAASNAFSLSSSARAFQPGVYHHCAGVFTSASERLAYLDGVAGTVETTSRTPAGIAHIGVGSEGNNLFKHTGNVFDAAIWNAALTAAEILRLKNGESPMTVRREALLAYWPCDDRNDTSIVDLVSGRVLAGSGTSLPKNIVTPDGYRKRGKTARIYSFAPAVAGGDTSISATKQSLVLTANAATVSFDVSISATSQALALTANQAAIAADTSVSASSQALTLTANAATVTLGVAIEATSQALVLTANQAAVAFDVSLSATSQALTLTAYQASVAFGTEIAATTQALSLTTAAASIAFDVGIAASLDALLMTTYAATVQSGAVAAIPVSVFLSGSSDGLVMKDGGGILISGTGDAAVGMR